MTFNFHFHSHNVHLFAYYLSKKTDGLGDYQPDWLWEKCDDIVSKTLNPQYQFNIKENLDLENESEEPWANLNKNFPKTDDYHPIYVQPHQVFIDSSSNIDLVRKTSIIYPVQLYDSYGLGIKLISPQNENGQTLSNTDIALVNPDNCLMLDVNKENQYFLGQTLLITINLEYKYMLMCKSNREKLKRIADNYLESLLPNHVRKPQFNRSGDLFGSPIFEYGIIRASKSYSHVIIWFLIDDKSEEKLNRYYQQLLDLFFFRAKIVHAYEQIIKKEKSARNKSKEIQLNIQESQKNRNVVKGTDKQKETNELDLDRLQTLLMELPKFSVEHANNLRLIKKFQNVIVENTSNYTDKIHEIKSNLIDEDFSFLELFKERTCHPFQDRIMAAVNFFQLDTNLINNAIDSIRGQVAIEQTRRERQLQTTITSLGIGIAVAGNLASSYEAGSIAKSTTVEIPIINIRYKLNFDIPHFIISFTTTMFVVFFVRELVSRYFRRDYKRKQLIKEE
jgi:hypothetical protein